MATVALKERTYDLLKHLKEETEAETFDETIRTLVLRLKKPKRSLFGALRGVQKEFTREELDRFN